MNNIDKIVEGVKLARLGKQEGFSLLYNETYNEKYRQAYMYMKNEDSARDVLQDAYVKAFSKLNTLEAPEKFASWLGTIVANTAKNELVKKNPMLFSELEKEDGDGEIVPFDIEDESDNYNPQLQLEESERAEILEGLLNSLSAEQRICISMFYYERKSISEISEILNVPENTIKSRLNYGKKNLKAKCEEYEKRGYKFLSVAPVALLLFLLRSKPVYAQALAGGTAAASVKVGLLSKAGAKVGIAIASLTGIAATAAIAITIATSGNSKGDDLPLSASTSAAVKETEEAIKSEEEILETYYTEKVLPTYKYIMDSPVEVRYSTMSSAWTEKKYESQPGYTGIAAHIIEDLDSDGEKELLVLQLDTSRFEYQVYKNNNGKVEKILDDYGKSGYGHLDVDGLQVNRDDNTKFDISANDLDIVVRLITVNGKKYIAITDKYEFRSLGSKETDIFYAFSEGKIVRYLSDEQGLQNSIKQFSIYKPDGNIDTAKMIYNDNLKVPADLVTFYGDYGIDIASLKDPTYESESAKLLFSLHAEDVADSGNNGKTGKVVYYVRSNTDSLDNTQFQ